MMQIIITQIIAGFLRLSSASDSNDSNDDIDAISSNIIESIASDYITAEEELEREQLKRLAQEECVYTEDYDMPAEYRERNKEYCKMRRRHFEMFALLKKSPPKPYTHACEDGKRVVGIPRLIYNADPAKHKSPRKWMDYVIFYSIGRRVLEIDDDVFLGIAIYSHFYEIEGEELRMLIDNLRRLHIEPTILGNTASFHDMIYLRSRPTPSESATQPFVHWRGMLHLNMLERVMKNTFIGVLQALGIPFSIRGRKLRMLSRKNRAILNWCEKDDELPMGGGNSYAVFKDFDDVIMEQTPQGDIFGNDMVVLLTLIGMFRSGEHALSIECRSWFENDDFNYVLQLANINENIVGITNFEYSKEAGKMLESIIPQLIYLEMKLDHSKSTNLEAVEYIRKIDNELTMKISCCSNMDFPAMKKLLTLPNVKHVSKLQILDTRNDLRSDCGYLGQLKSMANNPKILGLELYKCNISLEGFLAYHDFGALKDKLRALEVYGFGDLRNGQITNADLRDLKIESLYINGLDREEAMDFDQLIDRGIITRDGFKYLVFRSIHESNRPGIVALRKRLGARQLPVIVTDFNPPGGENVGYIHTDAHVTFYVLNPLNE